MHEMGIASQVIQIALDSVPEHLKHIPVEKVLLKVGKLSTIIPDNLRFCFEVLRRDTPLAQAELVIEEIQVQARCRACLREWEIREPAFVCPHCQSGEIELLSGQELEITAIELQDG